MEKKEKWYQNISLLMLFMDTPIGLIAVLKNKQLKRRYRIWGITVSIIGIAAYVTYFISL